MFLFVDKAAPLCPTSSVDISLTRRVCSEKVTSLKRSHRDLSNERTFYVHALLDGEISMLEVGHRGGGVRPFGLVIFSFTG